MGIIADANYGKTLCVYVSMFDLMTLDKIDPRTAIPPKRTVLYENDVVIGITSAVRKAGPGIAMVRLFYKMYTFDL